MSTPKADPRNLSRAVEDLRYSHKALVMAASGIAADLHNTSGEGDGVYCLLMAVADQLSHRLTTLETLTGGGD